MNATIEEMIHRRWFPYGGRVMPARLARFMPLCAMLLMPLSAALASPGDESPGAQVLQPAQLHARLGCLGGSNAAPYLRNASAPSGAHLNYYGGRVLSNVKIIMVLYGSGTYQSFIANDAAPSMASFYQQVVNSSYLDWLCEYGTPTQTIGRGTYGGKVAITPSSANNRNPIDDSNIQAELQRQIQLGGLPAPDANTLYMVHFPQGKTITMGGTGSCVAGGFCAYHGTIAGSPEIFYGVMPDMSAGSGCATGCGQGATALDNQSSVCSHELIEAITDPEVGLATTYSAPLSWYDPAYGEIGDICNAMQVQFVGTDGHIYTVQAGFSNMANDCIASRPVLPPMANNQNVMSRQDKPIAIALSGLDANVCPRALTFSVTTSPAHGVLSGTAPL